MAETVHQSGEAFPPPLRPREGGTDRRYAPLRSIAALILREMSTRFGRTPGGYVWVLLQPLAMIVLLAFVFELLMRSPKLGTSFLLFKATGFMWLQMVTGTAGLVGNAMSYSSALLRFPGVAWIDAILARFLLNFGVTIVVTCLILNAIVIYDDLRLTLNWGRVAYSVLLAGMLGFGVGCLNCYLFGRFPLWQRVWAILTRPMFIISGVIILYEDMPPLAQQVLWYNPVLHLTGMARDGFYPMYRPEYISVTYVLTCALVPMVLGLVLLRRYHRELLNR